LGETQRRGIGRIRYGEDEIRIRRRNLARELTSERTTGPIYGAAEHATIGSCEVDILEDASSGRFPLEREDRAYPARVDCNDLAGRDFANRSRVHDVERARLGCENNRAIHLAHHERAP